MAETQQYNPGNSLNGVNWYGMQITWDNKHMGFRLGHLPGTYSKQQIIRLMYEITVEYHDGTVEIYDVLPEKYSNTLQWVLKGMQPGKTYNVTTKQKRLLVELWQVIHMEPGLQLIFSENYTKVKKVLNNGNPGNSITNGGANPAGRG